MIRNLLSRLGVREREPMFTADQLLETFQHGYRAGQAAGPAKPIVHRPLADICAEFHAERGVVVPLAVRS
jgi:hypothetical protein